MTAPTYICDAFVSLNSTGESRVEWRPSALTGAPSLLLVSMASSPTVHPSRTQRLHTHFPIKSQKHEREHHRFKGLVKPFVKTMVQIRDTFECGEIGLRMRQVVSITCWFVRYLWLVTHHMVSFITCIAKEHVRLEGRNSMKDVM